VSFCAFELEHFEWKASLMGLLARLRHKQGRWDESQLYFKNAIDIYSSADNAQFMTLAKLMHYYAQLLMDQGETDAARTAFEKSQNYFQAYVGRERKTADQLRARLRNPTRLRTVSELLTVADRKALPVLGTQSDN
jgi:hypothetical protein